MNSVSIDYSEGVAYVKASIERFPCRDRFFTRFFDDESFEVDGRVFFRD